MDYDILILGGGPAGLSTALHLTKLAPHLTPRILLLEKERYPRPKLCAGGLTVDAESLLERLGLDVREIPHVDAKTVHFDFEGKGLRMRNRKGHTLRVTRREDFDAWLAGKARASGIEIREGVTVVDVRPDTDGVTVVTDQGDWHAKIVIGADGSNGITRRCVLPKESVYKARVLEVITTVVASERSERGNLLTSGGALHRGAAAPRNGSARFEFSPVPHNISGYVWDFPTQVNSQPRRCWGIYDANLTAAQGRPPLKELLRGEMADHGYDLDDAQVQGFPIRWFEPGNNLCAPRVLLVGDAAGADPLFGEGISFALGYGLWAAKETARALSNDDFSFNGSRFRLLRSALGQSLLARWLIANIVYAIRWRWFQILLWRMLKLIVILVAQAVILNWGKRMKV
ncbi:MAG: NAD(P)/FAD-dependent oxidoreductase [Anaerolineales bacterium]